MFLAGVGGATDSSDEDDAVLRSFIACVRQTEAVKLFESVAEDNVAMMSERYLDDLIQMTWNAGFQIKEYQDIEHKVG